MTTTQVRSATSLRDQLPSFEVMLTGVCIVALTVAVYFSPTLQTNLKESKASQFAVVVGIGLLVLWQWAKNNRADGVIRVMTVVGPAAAILVVQSIVYPISEGVYLYGIVLGLLGSLVALGMALIYRANRILNFAQGDLGLVPTVLALDLIAYSGLPYLAGMFLGLGAAIVLGIVVEFFIIRRFFKAPRLILTVATIGLAQLLTFGALLLPFLWGKDPVSQNPVEPFVLTFEISKFTFRSNAVIALVVAPLCIAAVAVFLRYTSVGMAVRASAERADRASLLGIPVKRLQTVVWVIATVLSFVAVFMKAGLVGLPFASNAGFGTTSFGALVAALAALLLGRLSNLPSVAISAVALGVLEQATIWHNSENPQMIYPVLGLVVLLGLLYRATGQSRTEHDTAATWQAADEVRPIPRELRRVPEVAALKWGGLLLIGLFCWKLPSFGFMGTGELIKASAVVVFAIVGISIIMLTGWAGQVSLGQMAFVGFGAAVGALATREWNIDLSLAMLVAGLAGAAVAVVVGLPALRVRGLFLAVTTLAFAVTTSNFLLDPKRFSWIPTKRINRPPLFGRIDLESQTNMYYLCIAILLLAILMVTGLRRSRTGRVLLALRENERAAQSYGINITRSKLLAFALSGFLAAVAGCLFVHVTSQFSPAEFGAGPSFVVFTSTVVGGLGSIAGGILGAIFSRGGTWFLKDYWQLLPSAVGVLLVLLIFPGGISGLLYKLRDIWLRSVARRFGVIVPSLVADVRQDDPSVIEHAEEAVEDHEDLLVDVASVAPARVNLMSDAGIPADDAIAPVDSMAAAGSSPVPPVPPAADNPSSRQPARAVPVGGAPPGPPPSADPPPLTSLLRPADDAGDAGSAGSAGPGNSTGPAGPNGAGGAS